MTVELWVKALYPFEHQQNESNGQFWAAFSFQAAAGGIAAAKSGVGGAAAGCMFWDTCKVGQHALLDSLFHRNPIKIDENWGYPHFRKPPCECMARARQGNMWVKCCIEEDVVEGTTQESLWTSLWTQDDIRVFCPSCSLTSGNCCSHS